MPRAIILNSANVVGASGGTWGDTFAICSGDSFTVANYDTGGARLLEAWAMDSDSVAEIRWYYTRQDSTHDQSFGMRFNLAAVTGGGAGKNAALPLLPGLVTVPVFKSDVATIQTTSTASDDLVISWVTEYDDLPGSQAIFATWDQIQSLRKSTLGLRVSPTAGTVGLYGAARALNADDAGRLHSDTYYAILGATSTLLCTTIAITAPSWGGYKIGFPMGQSDLRSDTWFVDQSIKWQKPLIPVFNSNDAGGINVYALDAEASTVPLVDFLLYELTGPVS
jgi:hypothetical protein